MTKRRIVSGVAGPVGAAAAWGVNKALRAAYKERTGKQPPKLGQPGTPLRHALLWSVITAATLAIVDVVVTSILRQDKPSDSTTPTED